MAAWSVLDQRNLGKGKGKGHQFLLHLDDNDDSPGTWIQTKDLTEEQKVVIIQHLQMNPDNAVPRALAADVGPRGAPAVVDAPQALASPATAAAPVSSPPPHEISRHDARYQSPFDVDMIRDDQQQHNALGPPPRRESQYQQPSFHDEQDEDTAMEGCVSPSHRNNSRPMGRIIGDLDEMNIGDDVSDMRIWNGFVPDAGDGEDDDDEDDHVYDCHRMQSSPLPRQYNHSSPPPVNRSRRAPRASSPLGFGPSADETLVEDSSSSFAGAVWPGNNGDLGLAPSHQKNTGLKNNQYLNSGFGHVGKIPQDAHFHASDYLGPHHHQHHHQVPDQPQIRALPTPDNSSPLVSKTAHLYVAGSHAAQVSPSSSLTVGSGRGGWNHPSRAHLFSPSNSSIGLSISGATTPAGLAALPEPEHWTEFLNSLPSASAQNTPQQNNAAQPLRLSSGVRTQQPAWNPSTSGPKHARKSFFPKEDSQ